MTCRTLNSSEHDRPGSRRLNSISRVLFACRARKLKRSLGRAKKKKLQAGESFDFNDAKQTVLSTFVQVATFFGLSQGCVLLLFTPQTCTSPTLGPHVCSIGDTLHWHAARRCCLGLLLGGAAPGLGALVRPQPARPGAHQLLRCRAHNSVLLNAALALNFFTVGCAILAQLIYRSREEFLIQSFDDNHSVSDEHLNQELKKCAASTLLPSKDVSYRVPSLGPQVTGSESAARGGQPQSAARRTPRPFFVHRERRPKRLRDHRNAICGHQNLHLLRCKSVAGRVATPPHPRAMPTSCATPRDCDPPHPPFLIVHSWRQNFRRVSGRLRGRAQQ